MLALFGSAAASNINNIALTQNLTLRQIINSEYYIHNIDPLN